MSQEKTILIVDDDERIQRLLQRYLSRNGYQVSTAGSAAELREKFERTAPDLVILDLMLPDADGLDLARELRSRSQVPIVMLTGKDDVIDRVVGLELGADDYITKPFDERELLARLHSVMRRTASDKSATAGGNGSGGSQLHFSGYTLDSDAFELRREDGELVELTSFEFRLLEYMVKRPQRTLTRDQLLEALAERDWTPFDRSVDVMIGKLRKKLEENPKTPRLIKTIRGMGYKFTGKVEARS